MVGVEVGLKKSDSGEPKARAIKEKNTMIRFLGTTDQLADGVLDLRAESFALAAGHAALAALVVGHAALVVGHAELADGLVELAVGHSALVG